MHEMHKENVMLKAVWRSMQDQVVGSPMKINEQRKHRMRDERMKKLSSELFIRIIGVCLWWKTTTRTMIVRQAPTAEMTVSTMPTVS